MQMLQRLVNGILELPDWDRHRLARELGVEYATVCRWANGTVKQAQYEYARRLQRLWERLADDGSVATDESERVYDVDQGERMTVTPGSGGVKIINYGVVRIIVRNADDVETEE